jgi:hypothetical protein
MSSITYGGKLLMKAENDNKNLNDDYEDIFDRYPFKEPKVYLDGTCETYHPQYSFSWGDDSVVLVRDTSVVEYTKTSFTELLAKDKDGNIIWVDGRGAPYSNCWDGEYLGDTRAGQEFKVTLYDIKTSQKKRYKMVLDETSEFESWDYRRLADFVDEDTLGSHLIIKEGVLKQYFGSDKNLVIPDSVTKIDLEQFADQQQLESITIPKSVTAIESDVFHQCRNLTAISFDDPDGWRYYQGIHDTEGTAFDLSNPADNVKNLGSTYYLCRWRKIG